MICVYHNRHIQMSQDAAPRPIVTCHFSGIKEAIVGYLSKADGAYVCAAWFTCPEILAALGTLGDVSLLIGDPAKVTRGHHEYRRGLVEDIVDTLGSKACHVYSIPVHAPPEPGTSEIPSYQLMHHKFIVLIRNGDPYAVITGSYNYTKAAAYNIENIVYIEIPDIAAQYAAEFVSCIKRSTPLRHG